MKDGYYYVTLYNQKRKKKTHSIHTLVLIAFIGPRPPGMEARHFPDNDKSNNALTNLSWGTRAENTKDQVVHNTQVRGSKVGISKLLESDIPAIRAAFLQGETRKSLSKRYNVAYTTMCTLLRYETWNHV